MTERQQQPAAADSWSDLAELCARATELVRGLPGPVRRVALRTGDHGVDIEWACTEEPSTAGIGGLVAAAEPAPALAPWTAGGMADPVGNDDTVHVVRAPLVGTFYVAPQPGAAPFVAVGDLVEAGQTVGLVEAMKLMNAVTADLPGRVVEVLVGNREPVEFDQALFRLAVR
jgi:acetyl-CoA carboxylase biotin carboxyl carrier protein